jgi:hypothetical protein
VKLDCLHLLRRVLSFSFSQQKEQYAESKESKGQEGQQQVVSIQAG